MKLAHLAFAIACASSPACAARGRSQPDLSAGSEAGASSDASGAEDATTGISSDSSGASGSSSGGAGADASAGGGDGSARVEGGADGAVVVSPGSYALNPPKQCDNQFYVAGCTPENSMSACGGTCAAQSACEGAKADNPDIGFLCPRFILLGAEMLQAAQDDWGSSSPFNYAVVGHDPDSLLDPSGTSGARSCCQCYQLVFDVPNEAEGQVNGNSSGPSAVPVPPPLVVQTFNTAAGGGKNFDVFMGAGGFGGNNACDPNFTQQPSPSGKYLYTSFPEVGESGNGGEKAAIIPVCKTSTNLITTDTLAGAGCQSQVKSDCDLIAAKSAAVAIETVQSCVKTNDPGTFYHFNWKVYAKRIACPTHLTEVTGCKLASQNLPAANPNVTTATQAAADPTFTSGYTTTTMQDCCKPTCAWQDNVSRAGPTVGQYNSFYSCDQTGTPVTE